MRTGAAAVQRALQPPQLLTHIPRAVSDRAGTHSPPRRPPCPPPGTAHQAWPCAPWQRPARWAWLSWPAAARGGGGGRGGLRRPPPARACARACWSSLETRPWSGLPACHGKRAARCVRGGGRGACPLVHVPPRRCPLMALCTQIYGKAEFLNPGGSVKDRVALRIVAEALQEGRLQPGGLVTEGTAGSTGVSLAMVRRPTGRGLHHGKLPDGGRQAGDAACGCCLTTAPCGAAAAGGGRARLPLLHRHAGRCRVREGGHPAGHG